jgi:hypothetical protein
LLPFSNFCLVSQHIFDSHSEASKLNRFDAPTCCPESRPRARKTVTLTLSRKREGINFHESQLLEWSAVTVPAAPGALIESSADIQRRRDVARRQRDLDVIYARAGT